MAARTRNMVTSTSKGTGERFGNTIGNHTTTSAVSDCHDVVGKFDNAYFNVERWSSSGGRMNGRALNNSVWKDYFADAADYSSNWSHMGVPGLLSEAAAVTKGAARANPSTPYVDVPVFIGELRELPDLIKSFGDDMIRQMGDINLRYQFGVAPMVGDVVKMFDFRNQIERRLRIIEKLQTTGGYRKTVTVGSGSVSAQTWKLMHSNYTSVSTWVYGTTTATQKVHCRYSPLGNLSKYTTDQSRRALAESAVKGLAVSPSTAWKLIPWSWFADWFGNVGDYLEANRNTIPCELTSVTYMLERRTSWWSDSYRQSGSTLTMSPFRHDRVSKLRKPSGLAIKADLPFITDRQFGILGSLALTRRR